MKTAIITGGAGFIGCNLTAALRAAGWEVTVFDNLSRRGSEILSRRAQGLGARFIHGDIRNPEDLERLGDGADLLLECSAEPSVLAGTDGADARFVVSNNLVGSLHCFEWARARRTPVIFLSTSRVYPYDALNARAYRETDARFEPAETTPGFGPGGVGTDFPLDGARSLYGATKLASEIMLQEYARQYDLPALINRCGVIAGPWQLGKVDQGVFTHWLACHYFNRPLNYIGYGGTGKQVRDLLHVDDLTELILRQAGRIREFHGDVFNAGGSAFSNLSLRETTALCRALTGRNLDIGARPENRPADLKWFVMNNGATSARFDWRPRRDAATILRDTHEWLRTNESDFRAVFGA